MTESKKWKKFDLEVEAEIEVDTYCYECGEDMEIEDIEATKYGKVTIGLAKHKCKTKKGDDTINEE